MQDAKADVILKYSADEARNLKSYGENIVDVNILVDVHVFKFHVYRCSCLSMIMFMLLMFFACKCVYILIFISKSIFGGFTWCSGSLLVSSGEFPESVKINETVDFVGGEVYFAINVYLS